MKYAARAIIFNGSDILIMHRNKYGTEYFTLVGGRLNDNETPEQAVAREVKEETGLTVTSTKLVFTETHPEPYTSQYIFLCEVDPHDGTIAITSTSEEALMNKLDMNTHTPQWVNQNLFGRLPFSTMQLQKAIVDALKNGFPDEPLAL